MDLKSFGLKIINIWIIIRFNSLFKIYIRILILKINSQILLLKYLNVNNLKEAQK